MDHTPCISKRPLSFVLDEVALKKRRVQGFDREEEESYKGPPSESIRSGEGNAPQPERSVSEPSRYRNDIERHLYNNADDTRHKTDPITMSSYLEENGHSMRISLPSELTQETFIFKKVPPKHRKVMTTGTDAIESSDPQADSLYETMETGSELQHSLDDLDASRRTHHLDILNYPSCLQTRDLWKVLSELGSGLSLEEAVFLQDRTVSLRFSADHFAQAALRALQAKKLPSPWPKDEPLEVHSWTTSNHASDKKPSLHDASEPLTLDPLGEAKWSTLEAPASSDLRVAVTYDHTSDMELSSPEPAESDVPFKAPVSTNYVSTTDKDGLFDMINPHPDSVEFKGDNNSGGCHLDANDLATDRSPHSRATTTPSPSAPMCNVSITSDDALSHRGGTPSQEAPGLEDSTNSLYHGLNMDVYQDDDVQSDGASSPSPPSPRPDPPGAIPPAFAASLSGIRDPVMEALRRSVNTIDSDSGSSSGKYEDESSDTESEFEPCPIMPDSRDGRSISPVSMRDDLRSTPAPSSQAPGGQSAVVVPCPVPIREVNSSRRLPIVPYNRPRRILVPDSNDLPITTVSMRSDAQFFQRTKRSVGTLDI
ncbi:hypothetical protein DXG03_000015 [Asterophora parasitica]|uniref:Uncharacterized protein n=1 Tax=Asterophora parasitica TaxID=117018 RepID=A0A9P7GDR6_9AGAR|nr:hypothetical protein DXG03_000015 [Asterophora parasitica]